ncbi:hypothetical protein L6452_06365 [Arctium lappa]|uniref:Uncharacterized protein n=1 Tax=Arctium lappa TaxID=4217 RepID=A0ACB9EJN2_ARCLA|nr:hypothetical protein L6452_06365 [Arctium lappa]
MVYDTATVAKKSKYASAQAHKFQDINPVKIFILSSLVQLGAVISQEYSLEYGTDKIEMHVGAVQEGERALVIDDLIATGGTLCAAISLLERVGVKVVECACVIELPDLKGRDRLGDKPLFVLVS